MPKLTTKRSNIFKPTKLAAALLLLNSPLYAQDSPGNDREIEKIVVNARKKVESIQETPIAVTAMYGNDLQVAGIENVLDLQSLAPGMQVSTAAGTARVFIRGIGLTNFANGGEASVAYHIDNAVISRPSAQISGYFDLERIEVLRGPQGSLYGRNATGGSINVYTKRPTEDFEGFVNATLGNFNQRELEGAVSIPLIENKLLARVAFKTEDRDGFGTNYPTNSELDNADAKSLRASFRYIGTEDLDIFLSLTKFDDKSTNDYHMLGPANPNVVPPEMAMGGEIALHPRDNNSEVNLYTPKNYDSATLEVTWDINSDFSFKSISNMFDFDRQAFTDLNGTPVPFFRNDITESSDQMSQEFQFNWNGENHSTIVGLYYFNEDIIADTYIHGPPAYSDVLHRPFIEFYGEQSSRSTAIFWNTTWNFDEQWSVTTGLRYSEDEKQDSGFTLIPSGITLPIEREAKWDAWTPTLTLEYKAKKDLFFYVTASKGYKAGVMNIGSVGPVVNPEYIWNFEGGMKSRWLDNKMQLNATLFRAEITDLQVQRPVDGNLITVNAAEAKTQGIEIEAKAFLSNAFSLNLNLALIDGEFTDFVTANTTFAPDTEINLSGNTLPNTPKLQTDLGLRYDSEFENGWLLSAYLQGIYTSERYFNEFSESIASQDATFTVNANINFTSPDELWTVNLWTRNMTDEFIYSHVNVTSSAIGHMRAATFMNPRMFGITLGYQF
jgi:iron complex outermembrane receptor protein